MGGHDPGKRDAVMVHFKPCASAAALCIAFVAWFGTAVAADDHSLQQLSEHGRARCKAIPRDRYFTGLIFNPEHLETGYERSRCFQELAEQLRDRQLCRLATERKSWFFDGSGISPKACKANLEEGIRQDRMAAGRVQSPQRLVDLVLNRDGNGRDIDVHVLTSGGAAGSYWLTLSVIDADGVEQVVRQGWQPMGSADTALVVFIRRESLPPPRTSDRESILHATLERRARSLDAEAIYSSLPSGSHSSTLQRHFLLSALEREPLTRP